MKKQVTETIFGLDIGTRTVMGILGYHEGEQFVVTHSTCMEHEERAMLDGQIHDIHKVAKIVQKVKEELEMQGNRPLTEVAIAAAGRVLNTQIVMVTKQFDEAQEMTKRDIEELEVYGIDEAKKQLELEKKIVAKEYFCIGYTVIQYFLDDYAITNLEGHKGYTIGAKVLCTFLPKSVIDSLYAVTERVGLEVSHLTLEPIAAINAIIPQNLRRLNLALVDIGAGTSDIAITKEGSIVAYGMIPLAGDEVTETIMNEYLVDFNTAEKIKQQISIEEKIEFEDIIGIPYEITGKEVTKCITPIVKQLAETISHKILELNGGIGTNAVFCVGGGSQMSKLNNYIAKYLQLPEARVAVRTGLQVTDTRYECEMPLGPEMITPLGICLTALKKENQKFTRVKINDREIQLLNSKKLTILDALIHEGIDHTQLFPKRGKTLMFKLNGERIRIKGESGEAAYLLLNGKEATLNTPIHNQDIIKIHRATEGKSLVVTIRDYVSETRKIYINSQVIYLPIILVGGDSASLDYQIAEKDEIEILNINTLGELLHNLKISINKKITVNQESVFNTYILNEGDSILIEDKIEKLQETEADVEKSREVIEEEIVLEKKLEEVVVKNRQDSQEKIGVQIIDVETEKAQDRINTQRTMQIQETASIPEKIEIQGAINLEQMVEIEEKQSTEQTIEVQEAMNRLETMQEVSISQEEYLILRVNGKDISLPIKENPYIFVNIFDYIDFDLTRPQGSIMLKLNNVRAAFTDELKDRDQLEIYWEK